MEEEPVPVKAQSIPDLDLNWKEREYLEKVYIDYIRQQYPTLQQFRDYAKHAFNESGYRVADWTQSWPKDVRICLINNLNLSDIVKLARTSRHWALVITSPSYDVYWKNRYIRDFPECPPTAPLPSTLKVPRPIVKAVKQSKLSPQSKDTVKKAPPKKPAKKIPKKQPEEEDPPLRTIPLLWFDIYQYTATRLKGGAKAAMGRKCLRTFLERKKNVNIYNLKFPDISIASRGYYSSVYSKSKDFPIKCFPNWMVKLWDAAPVRVTIPQVAEKLADDIHTNPDKHMKDTSSLVRSALSKDWLYKMPPNYGGYNQAPLTWKQVFNQGPIHVFLTERFKPGQYDYPIYDGQNSRSQFIYYMRSHLMPSLAVATAARWEEVGVKIDEK